jgi:sugar-specific transcriptional regulator TrmB
MTPKDAVLQELLQHSGSLTARNLAELTELPRIAVYDALSKLANAGLVEFTEGKHVLYRASPLGLERLLEEVWAL